MRKVMNMTNTSVQKNWQVGVKSLGGKILAKSCTLREENIHPMVKLAEVKPCLKIMISVKEMTFCNSVQMGEKGKYLQTKCMNSVRSCPTRWKNLRIKRLPSSTLTRTFGKLWYKNFLNVSHLVAPRNIRYMFRCTIVRSFQRANPAMLKKIIYVVSVIHRV